MRSVGTTYSPPPALKGTPTVDGALFRRALRSLWPRRDSHAGGDLVRRRRSSSSLEREEVWGRHYFGEDGQGGQAAAEFHFAVG